MRTSNVIVMSGLRLIAIDANTKQITHPSNANKGMKYKYKCLNCNEDVIVKQGDQIAWHFAHKTEGKCECTPESQIHKNAKKLLKHILDTKIKLTIFDKCKCNKFTVIPEISDKSEIIIEYKFSHNDNTKFADVAYLDDNGKISYIFEIYYSHKTNESDRPEPWFELDAKDLIDKFNNSDSKSIEIRCIREKKCDDCNVQKPEMEKCRRNGVIYFNQRGAGCGKTYESIQLMDKDERFNEKTTFIYLTKMHSAKEVIYNELKDQGSCGKLKSLKLLESTLDDSKKEKEPEKKQYKLSYIKIDDKSGEEKEIEVIIGTIDSFTYAIAERDKIEETNDYFIGILKTISKGGFSVQDSKIRYAGANPCINNNCLIIIDEAQDLINEYMKAFNRIIEETDIDLYVIGDKLQSILGENNIYTEIDNNKFNTEIIRSDGINKVMRFHNNQFINFVNKIIPFDKYGLPKITDICNGNCKYTHENDDKPYELFQMPSNINLDNNTSYGYRRGVITTLISYMKKEINKNGYLPKHFMFIFPILSCNKLAIDLEIRIQKFWIDKFDDKKYQEDVLSKDTFWKDKLNDNQFYKYIYLHKSDEGKSINLKESENATRILSIHASKGNGCEVVFVLGINEKSLTIFSKDKCNLQYYSLLHVAITRQKKRIYMGIELNKDDIHTRFECFDIKPATNIVPNIDNIKTFIKMSNIKQYLENDEEWFEYINEKFIKPNNLSGLLTDDDSNNGIIDYGHHMIRYAVMVYNFSISLIGLHINTIEDKKERNNVKMNDQYYTILKKISNMEPVLYCYKKYKKALYAINGIKEELIEKSQYIKKINQELNELNIKKDSEKELKKLNTEKKDLEEELKTLGIPLLKFKEDESSKYYKYAEIIKRIIKNIQKKIKTLFDEYENIGYEKDKYGCIEFPHLCPLESVILLFVVKTMEKGRYCEISIMDIYTLVYNYDCVFNAIQEEIKHDDYKCICKEEIKHDDYKCICKEKIMHDDCKCICKEVFNSKNDNNNIDESIKKSILKHYESINKLKEIYDNYIRHINTITYRIGYKVFKKCWLSNGKFKIMEEYTILGINDEVVVYFIFKPNFNKLNFNKTISDSIIDNYLLLKEHKNKKIHTCIISLNSSKPKFYELNITPGTEIYDNIKKFMKKGIYNKYSLNHDMIFNWYNDHKSEQTDTKFISDIIKKLKGKPEYILDCFNNIESQLKTCKKNKREKYLLDNVNKDSLISELNKRLDTSIDDFLEIESNEGIEENDSLEIENND